ncbi:NAD-dependent epimerase/dehydratase family protein [Luteolibacter marinus]|uniref:NAD-dependent epimerase/dehydratase family protein n=1 Tax=Luteolibacter marinus TaxID=2776705 RepID=UPI001866A99A|nr:NAD-dependent epimerase/dehydratase family protein [Luteolibacter marinus]
MKTRILVTGASGFVGGSFCRRFADRDDLEIRGLGRRATELPGYVRADLTRPLELDWTPDVVIHAAARSSPWGSLAEFRLQNVTATRHVRDFCVARGVPKLIYISSSSVFYRECDQEGMTEDSPIGPGYVNHYARTKSEGEEVVRGFPGSWCILRPRAVFGAGDTVLFPRILRAAREGRMAAISRPGPPATGDLICIESLCDYLLRAAIDPAVDGEINLTNNQPVEIQAFIADIFRRLDIPPPTRRISRDRALVIATLIEWFYKGFRSTTEPPITRFGIGVLGYSKTFDVAKCLRVLGPPSVSLEEGVDRFIRWQKEEPA